MLGSNRSGHIGAVTRVLMATAKLATRIPSLIDLICPQVRPVLIDGGTYGLICAGGAMTGHARDRRLSRTRRPKSGAHDSSPLVATGRSQMAVPRAQYTKDARARTTRTDPQVARVDDRKSK